MKTPEQIKGAIRNISKKTGINPNSLLQMCLFEGILEKLSKSKYSKNFILKGGLLISSLIGVDMRSTMDMDTTLRGIPLSEATISKILDEILELFQESKMMEILWKKYTQNNPYVKDIDFLDTISVYEGIGTVLNVNDDIK